MNIGIAIKTLRTQRHWSQQKLASHLGLERSFISMVEKGNKSPSLSVLLGLCSALEVSPAELFTLAETDRNPNQLYRMINIFMNGSLPDYLPPLLPPLGSSQNPIQLPIVN